MERQIDSNSDDSDDESDDDFNIQVGESCNTSKIDEVTLNSMMEEDRSTHFIAIKVTIPDIITKAMEIQQHITKKEEVSIACGVAENNFWPKFFD